MTDLPIDERLLAATVVAAGLLLGALLTFLLMRVLARSRVEAATLQARSDSAVAIATLEAQAGALQADLARARAAQADAEALAGTLRAERDRAHAQLAGTTARAERIPALEARIVALEKALATATQQASQMRELASQHNAALKAERAVAERLRAELQEERTAHEQAGARVADLRREAGELRTRVELERQQADEKMALLQSAREELSNQFKALAGEILDEKAKRFTEQNEQNLGQILNPLKERIQEFRTKVEEIHTEDTRQQGQLKAELDQLKALNQQITAEAHGLAVALKGQAKKQGNWGELVLGNVLDRSGLREGQDFRREVSFNTDEGRKRPDVVVNLPQGKHLVIDAKVSLNAYTRYVNAESDVERVTALREHVAAVAERIDELSSRSYFELPGLNTPEMVFMFVPIESAFVEALRADGELFQRAIEKNVLVATPTTLLTSLNIVRQLWRFEERNAHTTELADRAGKVYQKLVSFVTSMEAVGNQLERARTTYDKAMGQLVRGKGNLINQAKAFEQLGVSVQAALPQKLVAHAALELDSEADPDDEALTLLPAPDGDGQQAVDA